jgi:hypothetical protein
MGSFPRPKNGKSLRRDDRTKAQELADNYGGKRLGGPACIKYWDIIAANLSKAGWSWGCISAR